jgi:hypothetical protein
MRALPNETGRDYTNLTNLAILRYSGAPEKDPSSDPTTNIPKSLLSLNETDLHVCSSGYPRLRG